MANAQASGSQADRLVRRGQGPSRLACAAALVVAALGTVAAGAMVREAGRVFSASWSTAELRNDLNDWSTGRAPWTPEQWQQAEGTLKAALELTPDDVVLIDQLAQLHALRGQSVWTGGQPGSPEIGWYTQALTLQQRSVALRPGNAQAWASLAVMQSAAGQPAATVFASWRRANELGPKEEDVQPTLAALVLRHWQETPEDVMAWMLRREPGIIDRLRREGLALQKQAAEAEAAAAAEVAASAAAAERRAALEVARQKARQAGY
ncbi:hypothetical protein [Sphaerotilus hippei]|nr:hypothetical protein [Sphaerotilus hippei]